MDYYLIRFAQAHEPFRKPEIEALSRLTDVPCNIVSYSPTSPFCVVQFPHASDVTKIQDFGALSILSRGIYELWGQGSDYAKLHEDVKVRSRHLWSRFKHVTFKFSVDVFGHTKSEREKREIINSFSYLAFEGKISMTSPQSEFTVFEQWESRTWTDADRANGVANAVADLQTQRVLHQVYLGRKVADSRRQLVDKHDLKKRPYISTTSMDAELALVTAVLALAGPCKLVLDPFVGTGGFMVAAAELGAVVLGSDIDGRSFRGKGAGMENGVGANFKMYGLQNLFGDCITSDLTNTPFRTLRDADPATKDRWLDGIICDPPYGVREGLKVLGSRPPRSPFSKDSVLGSDPPSATEPPAVRMIDGVPAHTLPGYIPPKKPYSFVRMLDDILDFAVRTLVDGGRLAFWMPSANENENGEEEATVIPTHHLLELKHECVQRFNKWSRRLLVYERLPGGYLQASRCTASVSEMINADGRTADELNPFRKRYFQPSVERNGT